MDSKSAPKRIWAHDADPSECYYTGGGWWDDECGNAQYPHVVEYVRADLARPKVKPLEWVESRHFTTDDDNGPREGIRRSLRSWTSGRYEIIQQDSLHGLFILRGKSDGIGLAVHALEAAKAAAQADHEARILEALE